MRGENFLLVKQVIKDQQRGIGILQCTLHHGNSLKAKFGEEERNRVFKEIMITKGE